MCFYSSLALFFFCFYLFHLLLAIISTWFISLYIHFFHILFQTRQEYITTKSSFFVLNWNWIESTTKFRFFINLSIQLLVLPYIKTTIKPPFHSFNKKEHFHNSPKDNHSFKNIFIIKKQSTTTKYLFIFTFTILINHYK